MLQLKRDLGEYYGYNRFMLDALLGLFSVPEALEAVEVPVMDPPVVPQPSLPVPSVVHALTA